MLPTTGSTQTDSGTDVGYLHDQRPAGEQPVGRFALHDGAASASLRLCGEALRADDHAPGREAEGVSKGTPSANEPSLTVGLLIAGRDASCSAPVSGRADGTPARAAEVGRSRERRARLAKTPGAWDTHMTKPMTREKIAAGMLARRADMVNKLVGWRALAVPAIRVMLERLGRECENATQFEQIVRTLGFVTKRGEVARDDEAFGGVGSAMDLVTVLDPGPAESPLEAPEVVIGVNFERRRLDSFESDGRGGRRDKSLSTGAGDDGGDSAEGEAW